MAVDVAQLLLQQNVVHDLSSGRGWVGEILERLHDLVADGLVVTRRNLRVVDARTARPGDRRRRADLQPDLHRPHHHRRRLATRIDQTPATPVFLLAAL